MMRSIGIIAVKELRDAYRNKWFLLYAIAFVVLALGLSWLGLAGSGAAGMAGFSRTTAALINLVLLIMPLMGLSVGAMSIASERERGTMASLLSQPLTRLQLLLGKWLGLALALVSAVLVGFGLPGIILAIAGSDQDVASYVGLAGLSLLVGLSALGVGVLVSCSVSNTSVAVGLAIGVWLVFVFIGDLGLLGAGMAMHMSAGQLLAVGMINPLTDFRIAALKVTHVPAETLGPAGLLLDATFGSAMVPLLCMVLVIWAVIPVLLAHIIIRRKEIR